MAVGRWSQHAGQPNLICVYVCIYVIWNVKYCTSLYVSKSIDIDRNTYMYITSQVWLCYIERREGRRESVHPGVKIDSLI